MTGGRRFVDRMQTQLTAQQRGFNRPLSLIQWPEVCAGQQPEQRYEGGN